MNAVRRGTDRLLNDLQRVVGDSEDLLRATGDVMTDSAARARERLRDTLDALKDSCEGLQVKTCAIAKTAQRSVREHPYQALGAALVLTFLAGLLLTRK